MTKTVTISRSQLFLRIFGGFLSGAFATFSFAPYSYWPIIFLSLLSLLLLIDSQKPKHALFIGLFWGLGQFSTGMSWVYVVIDKFGGLPVVLGLLLIALLIFYLALFPAFFAYLSCKIKIPNTLLYWLLIPTLWMCVEWLRGYLFTGLPWLWIGYSQIDGPFAPIAPILGVEGIGLFIMLFVSSIVLCIRNRSVIGVLPSLLVILACFLASQHEWVKPSEKSVSVAMIQGNVPQEVKWLPQYRWPTLLSYQDFTRKNWDADIIIWPEAAIPAMEIELPDFLSRLDSAAKNNKSAVITGVLDETEDGKFYNNVITLGENGTNEYSYPTSERYSKHHLLAFGEFVPFEDFLRPLAPIFNLPMSSFSRGAYIQPNLNAKGYKLATALCYEIAFNEQVRANINKDTDFILTLSNDTWFGHSIGPHQHLEIARMRALENGKPVLRATNTGITAAIDHKGKIIDKIPQFETLVLKTNVNTTIGQTPYTLWGSIPLYIWVALSSIICLIGYFIQRRTTQTE